MNQEKINTSLLSDHIILPMGLALRALGCYYHGGPRHPSCQEEPMTPATAAPVEDPPREEIEELLESPEEYRTNWVPRGINERTEDDAGRDQTPAEE